MGGEKVSVELSADAYEGSPPHGRGKGCDWAAYGLFDRITPAWAGKRGLALADTPFF